MAIRPSDRCSGRTLNCAACRRPTVVELIDGKDDGTGNFTVLHCPDCYGPGWAPIGPEFVEGGWVEASA